MLTQHPNDVRDIFHELDRLDRFLAKVVTMHEECDRIARYRIENLSLKHQWEGPA